MINLWLLCKSWDFIFGILCIVNKMANLRPWDFILVTLGIPKPQTLDFILGNGLECLVIHTYQTWHVDGETMTMPWNMFCSSSRHWTCPELPSFVLCNFFLWVPKMEAQKLSKKSSQNGSPKTFPKQNGSQNGSPKTFKKRMVPKMEAQKLSQKSSQNGSLKTFPKKIQNGSPKTCQKKWFPKWKPKNFQKKVVPKMEAPKLVKKSGVPKMKAKKMFPKKFPQWNPNGQAFPLGLVFPIKKPPWSPMKPTKCPNMGPT